MLIQEFLKEISPYCIVCGSYAREEETDDSDIDFYVKSKPQDVIDRELEENYYNPVEETYIGKIIEIAEKYNLYWTSVIINHIAVEKQENFPIMMEFSSLYKIPKDSPIKERELFGVKLLTAKDDKDCPIEDCIDS